MDLSVQFKTNQSHVGCDPWLPFLWLSSEGTESVRRALRNMSLMSRDNNTIFEERGELGDLNYY
jgi:hypothetical protein